MTLGVVVPVYNTKSYLEKCIDSIIHQSFTDIKVVLVDDGSTDGSAEICDNFASADNRVYVLHQKNQGKLAARYNGVKCLNTDYVTFVDSDDWLDLDAYMKLAEYMEKGIDIISFMIIRSHEKYCAKSRSYFPFGEYTSEKIKNYIIPNMIWDYDENRFGLDPSLCNKIIKRDIVLSVLSKVKYMSISYGDDMAVVYPLMKKINTFVLINEYLYYHRQRKSDEIAPYYLDKDYYPKLAMLYSWLKAEFEGDDCLIEQIDRFFFESTKYRMKLYKSNQSFYGIFPFDKIPYRSKIILYGASDIGREYYAQIKKLNYAEVVLWVDINFDKYTSLVIKSPAEIGDEIQYDYVVVAVKTREVAEEIKDYLVNKKNVKSDKVIWSYK